MPDGYITRLLDERRATGGWRLAAGGWRQRAPHDLTAALLAGRVEGRLLSDGEIVSIVRNWTVGELGTIAAAVGTLAHYLAANREVQDRLRADHSLLPAAIDEILHIHAPLVSNRHTTSCPVEFGGRRLDAGERLTILWASANRDEEVFGDPDEFQLDRDPHANLLYGAGIHVCPGATLARLALRVLMEELLNGTSGLDFAREEDAVRAVYPGSGFAKLPLLVL